MSLISYISAFGPQTEHGARRRRYNCGILAAIGDMSLDESVSKYHHFTLLLLVVPDARLTPTPNVLVCRQELPVTDARPLSARARCAKRVDLGINRVVKPAGGGAVR